MLQHEEGKVRPNLHTDSKGRFGYRQVRVQPHQTLGKGPARLPAARACGRLGGGMKAHSTTVAGIGEAAGVPKSWPVLTATVGEACA